MDINFGIKPFWFWNGSMEPDEIRRQVREMSDKGVGGCMIHPRQGLDIPYLSKTWFDRVGVVVETAKECGMEVWLYDEYPYPSGIAGGEVTLDHPEYEARRLDATVLDFSGPGHVRRELPFGEIVTATAYRKRGDGSVDWTDSIDIAECIGICHMEDIFIKRGLTNYNAKRYFAAGSKQLLEADLPEGEWHIMIFNQVPVKRFKYYDKFVDPLNPDAMAYFIQCTHERYKKYLGHEFGKTIRGIFSDEIAPNGGAASWSRLLPGIFERENGYSLIPKLPALVESMGPDDDKFRYDYNNTVTKAFFRSFDEQIRDWCERNNILYIGEKPILRSSQLKYMHIPGVDTGHHKCGATPDILGADNRGNAKMAASASHFYDKPRTLCEAFHSIGWGTTIKDMKWMYDYMSLFGINFFTPHAFYYSTDGLVKHDAPPSVFYQMPYWKHSKVLYNYLANLDGALCSMNQQVRTLLLDPSYTFWTATGEKSGVRGRLHSDYSAVQKSLYMNHIDFYYIDTDLLAEAKAKKGSISLHGENFDLLVVPPMICLEKNAVKSITAMAKAGVKIIFCGCLPIEDIGSGALEAISGWFGEEAAKSVYKNYVAGTPDDKPLTNGSVMLAPDPEKLYAMAAEAIGQDCSITETGDPANQVKEVLCSRFEDSSGDDCVFITNTGSKRHKLTVKLTTGKQVGSVCLVDLRGGIDNGGRALEFKATGDGVEFELDMVEYQAEFIRLCAEAECSISVKTVSAGVIKLDTDTTWDLKASGMNTLRLDMWKFEANGETGPNEVDGQPVIDQLGMSGIKLPYQAMNYFGHPKDIIMPKLSVKYTKKFVVETPVPMYFVIEPGSVNGAWHAELNGRRIEASEFATREFYAPSNLARDISDMIVKGENVMEVFIETEKTYDGIVNPLYIFGDFGLRIEGTTQIATAPATRGKVGDVTGNLLPFYAGDVVYTTELEISAIKEGKVDIVIDSPTFEDVAMLSVNGVEAGICAWSPYRWSVDASLLRPGKNEVALTCTNTLIGLFEGQYFNHEKHSYENIIKYAP